MLLYYFFLFQKYKKIVSIIKYSINKHTKKKNISLKKTPKKTPKTPVFCPVLIGYYKGGEKQK